MTENNRSGKKKFSFTSGILWALSGLLMALLLLEAALRLGGMVSRWVHEHKNSPSAIQKKDYRILCLGESMTAAGYNESYPSQLEKLLSQRGGGTRFMVINKGEASINSNYILEHLEENLNKYRPDMVTAMMGINERVIQFYADIPEADSWIFRNLRSYRFFRIMFNKISKAGERNLPEAPDQVVSTGSAGNSQAGDRMNYDLLRQNYRRMKGILDARKIKLCCMQYPGRNIADLISMFDSPGVIFVDNEWIFKEALKKGRFEDYFMDSFAGDFGHCTPLGNRLIAGNMADVILKELFPRGAYPIRVERQ
ncbi:MAG: hypothetical protein V2A78_02745 [bacterium]